MMQFAVYQLKNIPGNRERRFRPYSVLQEKGIPVRYADYEQVYTGRMQPGDTPERIRGRLDKQLPRNFKGHSISVGDVIVLNREGEAESYYVEKEGFTVIVDFSKKDNTASGPAVTIDTAGFHIEGKEGSWLAFDSTIIDGKPFFLMEHEKYGKEAAWVVVDEAGKLAVDNESDGFDNKVLQQIRMYMNPPHPAQEPAGQGKPSLENWQKYMENGEYLRSAEIEGEQNYNMIDGRRNNSSPTSKKGRPSVLAKLHRKQAEIAERGGKSVPPTEIVGDMERRRE